ncbi:MAG: class I SAM-dependent methyltransferase [Myxococcota bacterium]|nr:class I SAM-dependent methyltransferase [Myxococcota bacterium]
MKERVFRYRAVEKQIAASKPGFRVLDIGCGQGDNLTRLVRYGGHVTGIEPSIERAHRASRIAPTAAAVGEYLPFKDASFEMIYISHVLHHAHDLDAVLDEAHRLLVPGGLLFVIETIDDSPLMRLARRIEPSWDEDEVLNRFRFDELKSAFEAHQFEFLRGEKFNWMYFAWELLPLAFPPLDRISPPFIGLETLFHKPLGSRWGGHCFLVARKAGEAVFSNEGRENRHQGSS